MSLKLKPVYNFTATTTTTTIIWSSAVDTAAGLCVDQEYLKFRQLISLLTQLSAVTVSSNVMLDNDEVLKSSDTYEL
jgi:hypothetical protein